MVEGVKEEFVGLEAVGKGMDGAVKIRKEVYDKRKEYV